MSTDGTRKEAQSRVHAVSGPGEEAVQKSPKVKRKGPPARGEQLRTEEMKVITLLVIFELRVILTLEMTKLRLTRFSDLPKVIHLPSDEAWVQTYFPGSQASVLPTLSRTSHSLHPLLPWLWPS